MRACRLACNLIAAIGVAAIAAAGTVAAQAAGQPSARGDAPRSTLEQPAHAGEIPLSLDQAIALALAHNLDVELHRQARRLADTDLTRVQAGLPPRGLNLSVREGPRSIGGASDFLLPSAGFGAETSLGIPSSLSGAGSLPPSQDAVLTAGVRRTDLSQPQVNSFAAGAAELATQATTANVGLSKGFLTGGYVGVALESIRTITNNRRYDLNPFTASGLSITFTQPLLRGFGPAVNQRFVRVARNNREVSDLVFRQQVVTTVSGVVRLYWDLASFREEAGVRQQALARSERLLADTEVHAEVGTRAAIDVVRARAEVAKTRRDVIVAEGQVRQQEALLRDYLSGEPIGGLGTASSPLVPSDPLPADTAGPLPSAAALIEHALRTRPDVMQARLQVENSRVLLGASRNARLPAVDAVATVRTNGLAGTLNPLTLPGAAPHTADPLFLGGYGAALEQLGRGRYTDYVVGLQVTVPLQNRAASADYARDLVAVRQQEIRLQQIEKQVGLEIANALIALDQARASVEMAAEERAFQEQALAAEMERLDVGASTMFFVIQYQRDLAAARSAEVSALAAWAKARGGLDRASGQLLANHRVVTQ